MNPFANLTVSVLQIVDDGSNAPTHFVFQALGGRPALAVQMTGDLTQLAISEQGAGGAPTLVEVERLASPGCVIRVGTRDVHLQFLRARSALCRGPLLVFEDGIPLPCFLPQTGFWDRLRRVKPKALLPVHVVGVGDKDSRAVEIRSGLNLGLALLEGRVVPGRDDDAYLAPEQ